MSVMRVNFILSGFLATLWYTARVDAQPQVTPPPVDVEALHEVGNTLRAQNRPDAALRVFQIAFAIRQEARAQVRIALAELSMGRFVEAEEHFVQALQTPNDPWIIANRAQVQQALAQARLQLGTLEIRCNVPGAELRVNEARYRTLSYQPGPQRVRIQQGTWRVEIRADGYTSQHWNVEVPVVGPEDASARVTANLVRSQGSTSAPTTTGGASRTGAYVLMGFGGLALGAFAAFEAIFLDARARYDLACPDRICSPDTVQQGNRDIDETRTYGTLASVSVGVGATALLAGFVWWLAARPGSATPTAHASVSLGAGQAGLSLVGRF